MIWHIIKCNISFPYQPTCIFPTTNLRHLKLWEEYFLRHDSSLLGTQDFCRVSETRFRQNSHRPVSTHNNLCCIIDICISLSFLSFFPLFLSSPSLLSVSLPFLSLSSFSSLASPPSLSPLPLFYFIFYLSFPC